MSNTEDYLDGLLNSMEGKKNKDVEPEIAAEEPDFIEQPLPEEPAEETLFTADGKDAEQDFLDSFEREFLSGENTDEFIRQFERELDEDEGNVSLETVAEGEKDMSLEPAAEEDDMDFMVDTLGDIPGDDIDISSDTNNAEDDFSLSDDFDAPLPGLSDMAMTDEEETDGLAEQDQNLMDLLQSEGDFSDIGDMLHTEEAQTENIDDFSDGLDGFTLEEVPIDETMVLEDAAEENAEENAGKDKKEVSGFLKKISQALFGEEEEEELVPEEPVKASAPAAAPSIEDLSDENLMLLQELEGAGEAEPEEAQEAPETEEEAKARKKREKEEKKAKKKAERAEKKAQAKAAKAEKKAKKEKKPKKPKEPDRTPPLPKKPVILCFVMAGSFLALVLLGTNLFGYSSSMANAEKQFGLGNYEEAYQMVSGLEIKEQDDEVYQKYRVMGTVSGEYSAYRTFMEAGLYDMALDSLVRTVGRCQKYQPDAEVYGCTGELTKLHEQAAGALGGFGITEERALELYAMEEREDYSAQINTILEQAGYTID